MPETTIHAKTLQVKVRSNLAWLNAAAMEVNQVWNYANEISEKAANRFAGKPKRLSGFDLDNLTSGAAHCFTHIGSRTISETCHQYAVKRKKAKNMRLRWRSSFGSKRSLGWVPFKAISVKFKDGAVVFAGQRFRVFDSYGLGDYTFRAGSFAQNALGEWFFNVAVSVAQTVPAMPHKAVGIDLGLKIAAVCSDGVTLEARQFYRNSEAAISKAQCRGHKRHAKRLHLKA